MVDIGRKPLRDKAADILRQSGLVPASNVFVSRLLPLSAGFGTALLVYLFKDQGNGNESGSAPIYTRQVTLVVEVRVEGTDELDTENTLDELSEGVMDTLLTNPDFTRMATRFPAYGVEFDGKIGDRLELSAKIGIQAEWQVHYQPVTPNDLRTIAINDPDDPARTPFAPSQLINVRD